MKIAEMKFGVINVKGNSGFIQGYINEQRRLRDFGLLDWDSQGSTYYFHEGFGYLDIISTSRLGVLPVVLRGIEVFTEVELQGKILAEQSGLYEESDDFLYW